MEVYNFYKGVLQRIEEYSEVLCGREEPTRASEIRSKWSSYLESNLPPKGWQAIYNIPKECLQEYEISFPTSVFVMVNSIDWTDLTAEVEVIGIRDEKIETPHIIDAKITDLWPTKAQYNDYVDGKAIANLLDQLRFFYYNVWMPWDEDIDENIDWVFDHLENRIRMLFSLLDNPNSETSRYILGLISEAEDLKRKKDKLNEDLSDMEDLLDDVSSTEQYDQFIKINIKIKCIQEKVQLFESFGKCLAVPPTEKTLNIKSKTYFVAQETTIEEHLKHLAKISESYAEDIEINSVPSLEDALKKYKSGDTILLCSGTHIVSTEIKLVDNCKIRGIYNSQDTILQLNVIGSMVVNSNGCSTMENLTLEGNLSLFAICIKSGNLLLKNCLLSGGKHGIIVYSKCQVDMENCMISNFDKGIIGNNRSIINLSNSEIRNCDVGVDLYSTSIFNLQESKIKDCNEYGLQIESNEISMSSGDVDILDRNENVTIRGSSICDNKKSNIVIKSVPLTDPELYDPKFNPTSSGFSVPEVCEVVL